MMMLSNRYRRVAFYSGDQSAQSDGRAISDDDLCAWCAHLHYCPGETSICAQDWPCERDEDGYSQRCDDPVDRVSRVQLAVSQRRFHWPPLAAAKASRCQRLLSELVSACCQR